jgi:hypothetical protein
MRAFPNWIPLSPIVAQLAQDKQHEADAWRRKVATADQKAELRFLSITVKRDLTQGTCQDLINEACKDPTIRFKLELFRLKRKKEKEFSEFLLKNSFKLGIVNPTMAQLRETIDFLQDNIADWAAQTSGAEFATLILSRYPELKGNWEYPVADNSNIFDTNDDPATNH